MTDYMFCRMWRQLSKLTKLLQPATLNPANSLLSASSCMIRNFSLLSSNTVTPCITSASNNMITSFLQPKSFALNFDRGMKQLGRLKRRCKDCYFVMRHERLYVFCKTHPRHKQMAMKKKAKNTWLLTDATQSKKRAW